MVALWPDSLPRSKAPTSKGHADVLVVVYTHCIFVFAEKEEDVPAA